MRNVSDQFVKKNKTHVLCPITSPKSHVIYEIMWKNMVETDRPQMKI
jgi:hypothetical protein